MGFLRDLGTALGRPVQRFGQGLRRVYTRPSHANIGDFLASTGILAPIVSWVEHPMDIAYQAGAGALLVGGAYGIAAATAPAPTAGAFWAPAAPGTGTVLAPTAATAPAYWTPIATAGPGVGTVLAAAPPAAATPGIAAGGGFLAGLAKVGASATAAAASFAPVLLLARTLGDKAQSALGLNGESSGGGGGQNPASSTTVILPGGGGESRAPGQPAYQEAGFGMVPLLILGGVAVFLIFGRGKK